MSGAASADKQLDGSDDGPSDGGAAYQDMIAKDSSERRLHAEQSSKVGAAEMSATRVQAALVVDDLMT